MLNFEIVKTKNTVFMYCITLIFLLFLLSSCATKSEAYTDIDVAVQKNNFRHGIESIRKGQEGKKRRYPERNAVSLFLDKGLLEHYAGNYANSSSDLEEAERLIEEAYTKSVTANIASYIANENTKEYPGEDFEDIYLNIFNALNYYNDGKTEEALVEIRKLTWSSGKLDLLGRKYEDADSSAAADVLVQLASLGFTSFPDLPARKSANFSDSALARYLGALFYLGEGNDDSARIEFERLKTAFAANSGIYYHPFPQSAEDAQAVPEGKARLNVISFTGLSPIKKQEVFNQIFPFFQNKLLWYPQFKLPVLAKRPSRVDRVEVSVENEKFNLEILEDMGMVITETYNAHFSRVFFKTYIRTLLKYAAVDVAANEAAKRAESDLAELLAVASALAAKKVFDATEGADIRMSRYLPDKAYIGGINLDPGNYNVTVSFYAGNQIVSKEERSINIKANALNLIECVNLQ
jgi:hypothetical protein